MVSSKSILNASCLTWFNSDARWDFRDFNVWWFVSFPYNVFFGLDWSWLCQDFITICAFKICGFQYQTDIISKVSFLFTINFLPTRSRNSQPHCNFVLSSLKNCQINLSARLFHTTFHHKVWNCKWAWASKCQSSDEVKSGSKVLNWILIEHVLLSQF